MEDSASLSDWLWVIGFFVVPGLLCLALLSALTNAALRRAKDVPLRTKLLFGGGLWFIRHHH